MSQFQGIADAGEVIINEVTIINFDRSRSMNITNLIHEVNLFEDIFSPTITANILMSEQHNIISQFPIVGEELVLIDFITPSFPETFKIRKVFYLYAVRNRVMITDKASGYQLQLISQEAFLDANIKVSKSFRGFTHEIAKQIYNTYFKDYEKVFYVEDSTNEVKFVSNYWSPYKVLSYLASKSMRSGKTQSPSFLYYEDNKNLNFVSLDYLYERPAKTEYFFDERIPRIHMQDGTSVKDIERQYKTVNSIHIDTVTDYINRISQGVYSHRTYDLNLLNKSIVSRTYNYILDFDKSSHMEKHPMASENLVITDIGRHDVKVTYPYLHNEITKDRGAEIFNRRISLLSQTEMYKIDCSVFGRTDLKVGDVVQFNMLKQQLIDVEPSKDENQLDRYYTGRYLIAAIGHRINQTRHIMNLQLIKESFANKIGSTYE